jgi:hypothetical protein
MYCSGQTLVHKKTKKLARFAVNKKECSMFQWGLGENTVFVGEDGKSFVDDPENYTCVRDEFGRPISGIFSKSGPDLSLKRYVDLTKKQRLELKSQSIIEWEKRVLNKMDKQNSVLCPFSDGSRCWEMQKIFLRRRGARPLFKQYDSCLKRFRNSNKSIFEYGRKTWMFDGSELVVIKNISNV